MKNRILRSTTLLQAKVLFLLSYHYYDTTIANFLHVSEDDDEGSKRKKYLQAKSERAALLFEKKCQHKKIGKNDNKENEKKSKKGKITSSSLQKGKIHFKMFI